jgi:hypothetical protein
MKIFLIYPNSGSQVGFNYGASHIAAVLKAAGHQVRFWQLCEDLEPLPDKNEFIARTGGTLDSAGLRGNSCVAECRRNIANRTV